MMTRLQRFRAQSGISQEQLAEAIGITRQAVGAAERDGLQTATAAQRYANAFDTLGHGVDAYDLIGDTEGTDNDS